MYCGNDSVFLAPLPPPLSRYKSQKTQCSMLSNANPPLRDNIMPNFNNTMQSSVHRKLLLYLAKFCFVSVSLGSVRVSCIHGCKFNGRTTCIALILFLLGCCRRFVGSERADGHHASDAAKGALGGDAQEEISKGW